MKNIIKELFKTNTITADETESAGGKLAKMIAFDAVLPRYIALRGDLGAGKTTFTRGFSRGAGYSGAVRSPTFALVNEYRGGDFPVFHFDMYRIGTYDELVSIGYYDYLDQENAVCVVEWSENISEFLPDFYIEVEIVQFDENRIIKAVFIGSQKNEKEKRRTLKDDR